MSMIAAVRLANNGLQFWQITASGGIRTRVQTEWDTDLNAWSDWSDFLAGLGGPGALASGATDLCVAVMGSGYPMLWVTTKDGGLFASTQRLSDGKTYGSSWTPWLDFIKLEAKYPTYPATREPVEPQPGDPTPGDLADRNNPTLPDSVKTTGNNERPR